MFKDLYYLPLSALQHYLYCQRQCALIHIEQVWSDNFFTAEGNALHEKADKGHDQTERGVRVLRALPVVSDRYRLTGKCDVVEILPQGQWRPVEYKRGKVKKSRVDQVQLCGQVLCLEEMTGQTIPSALLFYGQNRRRTEVPIDASLRQFTLELAEKARSLILSQQTPPEDYQPRRCRACSLLENCLPHKKNQPQSVERWLEQQLES